MSQGVTVVANAPGSAGAFYCPPFLSGEASGFVAGVAGLWLLSFLSNLCFVGADAGSEGAEACANDVTAATDRMIAMR